MRLFPAFSLLFSLGVAGCTASAGEALRPDSSLKTASIAPKAPVGEVGVPLSAEEEAASRVQTSKGGRLRPAAEIGLPGEANPSRFGGAAPATIAEAAPATVAEAAALAPLALADEPVQVASAAEFIHQPVRSPRFRDAKPVHFGRTKPAHYPVHGVDVSRWQGAINWTKLKAQGANFVYIKSTEGDDHIDPSFMKNWNGAAKSGLLRGAYHFFYWCSPAEAQAKWFIRNVPKVKGALPPVIDVEWNHDSRTCKTQPPRQKVLAKMQLFMDMLEAHYGQRPVIYTAPDFYDDNLKGAFENHPFWLRAVAEHPAAVYPGRDFLFWQYSGTGLASGVDNHIDLNAFNGSADGWKKWVGRVVR